MAKCRPLEVPPLAQASSWRQRRAAGVAMRRAARALCSAAVPSWETPWKKLRVPAHMLERIKKAGIEAPPSPVQQVVLRGLMPRLVAEAWCRGLVLCPSDPNNRRQIPRNQNTSKSLKNVFKRKPRSCARMPTCSCARTGVFARMPASLCAYRRRCAHAGVFVRVRARVRENPNRHA